MDERVLAAMTPYFCDDFYNPSASYLAAKKVRDDYENAKHSIAKIIGARPTEIVMTAGATESINLALNVDGEIITTAIEHPAVLETAKNHDRHLDPASSQTLSQKRQVAPETASWTASFAKGSRAAAGENTKIIGVNAKGRVDPAEITKSITDKTTLISVGYANSEIGTVQPIREIAEIVAGVREKRLANGSKKPIYLHVDASQAAGLLDLSVARLNVDMMTLNAGKCYGPKQVGLLYVRTGVIVKPLFFGGGQENGLRSGTENVAGAIGFARALELCEKKRKGEVKRLGDLRNNLAKYLTETFPDIQINGDQKHHLSNILNISLPGLDGERAVFALDLKGVMVATGSACAANKGTRSHVLAAIGLPDKMIDGSLRISLGRFTTEQEIAELKPILREVLERERYA